MNAQLTLPHNPHPLLARWVAPAHLTEAAWSRFTGWFAQDVASPLHLRDFFLPHRARALGDAIAAIPIFERVHAIIGDGSPEAAPRSPGDSTLPVREDLPAEEWASAPMSARFFRHDIARPLARILKDGSLQAAHREILQDFLQFTLLEPELRSFMACVTGCAITTQQSCEFARYRTGDFISEHSDVFDGKRVAGMNFYFDRTDEEVRGGKLGYKNERGEVFAVDPVFNSVSVFPIRPGCTHWVEPWEATATGRYTVSTSFRRP